LRILYTTGGYGGRSGNIFEALNYLAHFYLADPDEPLMFGNYIGDGVKGGSLERFPMDIQRGVRYHRFIDSYTDRHPEVLEAKRLFYPTQGKFSGVVVDVLFDHVLALHWERYHKESLADFVAFCHEVINRQRTFLPERSERFYRYMLSERILEGYATAAGIEKVFSGMDSRTRYDSNMRHALREIKPHWADLQGSFDRFFPDLVNECEQWKTDHGIQ